MKRILPILLVLLFLAACSAEGQAAASQAEKSSSAVSESIPEPEASFQPPDEGAAGPEEQEANRQRAQELFSDLNAAFEPSKESYSYFTCYSNGGPVVLEIGVIDEAAVDAYLSSWTGAKWDRLIKAPGSVSQARQEEFAKKAEALDLGPDISSFHVRARNGPAFTETGRLFLSVTVAGAEPLEDIPQEIKDLAEEMSVPEEMFVFLCNMTSNS